MFKHSGELFLLTDDYTVEAEWIVNLYWGTEHVFTEVTVETS